MKDRLFSILYACIDGLKSTRLVYYMYLFQIAGVDYNLKYKVSTNGLKSKGVDEFIDYMLVQGVVNIHDGVLTVTNEGNRYIDRILFTAEEWDTMEYIQSLLKSLSDEELYFICLVDVIMFDAYNSCDVEQLIQDKDKIKRTIALLSDEYSDDNFDCALKVLRWLRKGCSYDK